jgi:hypothetical protein
LKHFLWVSLFSVSAFSFSVSVVAFNREYWYEQPFPWRNTYLTNEEIEIINYFEETDTQGLIFTFDGYIGERLAGVGFLPVIAERTPVGIPLYYGIISPKEVYKYSDFSLDQFFTFEFYSYNNTDPVRLLRNSIMDLNLSVRDDFDAFLSYNIQYLITPNESYYSGGINDWILTNSMENSVFIYSNQPIFTTEHLELWKIY